MVTIVFQIVFKHILVSGLSASWQWWMLLIIFLNKNMYILWKCCISLFCIHEYWWHNVDMFVCPPATYNKAIAVVSSIFTASVFLVFIVKFSFQEMYQTVQYMLYDFDCCTMISTKILAQQILMKPQYTVVMKTKTKNSTSSLKNL